MLEGDQAMIGDGDAVGIAGEITQDVLGASEGRLEVNHPVLSEQGAQERGKGLLVAEWVEGTGESEFGVVLFQTVDELAAEDATEDVVGQEEVVARMNPASVVGRK